MAKFTNAQIKRLIKLGREEYQLMTRGPLVPLPPRNIGDDRAAGLACSVANWPWWKARKALNYVRLGYQIERDKRELARLKASQAA